ncbi:MAG: hypothetical protein ACFCUO_00945 [Rhodospirillales bacterium]
MSDGAATPERDIVATAARLQRLQDALGEAYWLDPEVRALQDRLRRQIGRYGGWSADAPPLHRRARSAARHESDHAHLLWPRPG